MGLSLLRYMKAKPNFRIITKLWKSATLSRIYIYFRYRVSSARYNGKYCTFLCSVGFAVYFTR